MKHDPQWDWRDWLYLGLIVTSFVLGVLALLAIFLTSGGGGYAH